MTSSMMSNFSAIFFDMDGLLVDTEPLWFESERELMARFGVRWRLEDQIHCLGGPMEKVGNYMSALVDHRVSSKYFTNELIELMIGKLETIELMPGLDSLLQEVSERALPCALVSASPRRIVDAVLSSLTEHPFEFSISADDVQRSKPHPDPYLHAASRFDIEINQALIIEDSPTGVRAARSSGAWVIAVPHITTIEPAPRSAVISSLSGHTLDSLWELVTR